MITRSDIECICNYTENSKPSQSVGQMHYIEAVVNDSEEYLLEIKKKNRDLAIDAIVDNKEDEYINREKPKWPPEDFDESSNFSSTSVVVKSISLTSSIFTNFDDLFISVINKLETLTSGHMTISKLPNVNIINNLSSNKENFEATSRKICTMIQMLNHLISSKSYIGSGTTVICGYDSINYIMDSPLFMPSNNSSESKGHINGMCVILSRYIKSNKIIVLRASKSTESGLNVINNINDGTYFMSETPGSWDRCITWFEVI